MTLESLTLYKLMILYLLNKVTFPLTRVQISNFFLEKEYAPYFSLQQALSELEEQHLISIKQAKTSSLISITEDGNETLGYFVKQIPVAIIDDMDIYLIENKYELRSEAGTFSDYYKSTQGDYIVTCSVSEGKSTLISLNLSVPDEEDAIAMCDHWKKASQDIYSYVMRQLL